jgi:hypothetical protein
LVDNQSSNEVNGHFISISQPPSVTPSGLAESYGFVGHIIVPLLIERKPAIVSSSKAMGSLNFPCLVALFPLKEEYKCSIKNLLEHVCFYGTLLAELAVILIFLASCQSF